LLELRWLDGGGELTSRYLFSVSSTLEPIRRLPSTTLTTDWGPTGEDAWLITVRNDGPWLAAALEAEDAQPPDATGWARVGDPGLCLLPGEAIRLPVEWRAVSAGDRSVRVSAWNAAESIVG